MKAAPLLVSWHNENSPIYSAHFEPHGKGRLATAGGDNNVRLWKIDSNGDDRKVTYLSTLIKHTQAVNVVRWCPRGELLGSAGDDGNVLLWVPSENPSHQASFGEDALEDKETWRVKHMCRSLGSEIYDMAWSPDGVFFITGSQIIRQVAEHNHYVQGVAWDPLNEFVATQSSDRSVHIYALVSKDGQFSLHNKVTRMDLPARRISNSSPAPPDFAGRAQFVGDHSQLAIGSPVPSAPGTPNSLALPMNPPPPTSHSRRSSFSSSRRSVSPAPSLPLPAVMPSTSPNIYAAGLGVRNVSIYANEQLTSFFRRLTFAPDGSLLFTPAGQYKTSHPSATDPAKTSDDTINTVYIYTRAGLHKPPVAHLPGHKKPSVAVRCSPIFYALRQPATTEPKQITIDTSSADEEISALPEPVLPTKMQPASSSMDPPPPISAPSPSQSMTASSPKPTDPDGTPTQSSLPAGPPPAFGLPYRMVYAVATQDAVHIYDTQQQKPLCIVSNLHYATFTDLTWSNDGLTLLMTSSDGFCSCLAFAPNELGTPYHGPPVPHPSPRKPPPQPQLTTSVITTAASSQASTPTPTPITTHVSPLVKQPSSSASAAGGFSSGFPASPSPLQPARPASPARSMSASSEATQTSMAWDQNGLVVNNPTPSLGALPSIAAAHSGPVGGVTMWTPPQTPMPGGVGGPLGAGGHSASSSVSGPVGMGVGRVAGGGEKRRESDVALEEERAAKKRRIAPTPVSEEEGAGAPPGSQPG